MEVLSAFVREKPPLKGDLDEKKTEDKQQPQKPRTDIQAALTVIGRRNPEKDPKNQKLNLSKADIAGADLIGANLQGAILIEANLQGAFLNEAKLQKAILWGAELQKAILWGAELQGADFLRAKLQEACLTKGANSKDAINLTQQQIESAYGDSTTILPENIERPAHWM
jgi:uncharacterized protein YjbI with pentapeptide repeats